MRYGSVCSGIEAATVAWDTLGWRPAFFSEIEKFPVAVLNHHYPNVPNLGDLTKHRKWDHEPIDVLVGGTPCQSFSIAGLRAGLDDPRGNLALEFLDLADRARPRWMVWENVPGVLSSNGGRDFGSILGALGKLGYGFAYRVLDAQFIRVDGYERAVPQRRRRVFVVGCLGDWRRAAAVLFERESLSGHSAPRRQTRESVAPTISERPTGGGGLGTDFDLDGGVIACMAHGQAGAEIRQDDGATTLTCDHEAPIVAFDCKGTEVQYSEDGAHPTLRSMGRNNSNQNGGGHAAVAFDMRGRDGGSQMEGPHYTANIRATSGGSSRSYVATNYAVRRLTPKECERLQGFPDSYTDVPYGSRNTTPDGPRYKALGNSMAVNVMRWVGRRIEMVESIEVSA